MAAPSVNFAGSGAAAGATFGPIGAGVGAAVGFIVGVFKNNDNALIDSIGKIIDKFRDNTPGGKSAKLFPIRKKNGGKLLQKYKLEGSDIKNRKLFGNYNKEWTRVAKFGAELLFLMYGREDLINMYVEIMKSEKVEPYKAFKKVVDFAGVSQSSTEYLREATGVDVVSAPAADSLTEQQLNAAGGKSVDVVTGGGCAPVVLAFFVFNAIIILTLWEIF